MITVEELIVQSLYHRLVLITVRRSDGKQPSPKDQENVDSDQAQKEASDTSVTENGSPDQGLGIISQSFNLSSIFIQMTMDVNKL